MDLPGSELARITRVAELARVDFAKAPVTLEATDDPPTLRASYRGAYCAGSLTTALATPPDNPLGLSIDGRELRAITQLLAGAPTVTLGVARGALTIRDGTSTASLRAAQEPELWQQTPDADQAAATWSVTLDRPVLATEVELAGQFVAETNAAPILQGIRLAAKGNQLRLNAADSVGAIYATSLTTAAAAGAGAAVLMPKDLLAGLRLLGDGPVHLFQTAGGRVTVWQPAGAGTPGEAVFTAGPLDGAWPNFQAALAGGEDGTTTVVLPAGEVLAVTAAAEALQTGRDVELVGQDDGTVTLRTPDGDHGTFARRVAGDASFVGVRRLDAATLHQAARLGAELVLGVPADTRRAVVVTAGARWLWLVPKYA